MTTDFDRWAAELAEGTETVNCGCGHPKSSHLHLRRGSDCVVCGCMTYRPPRNTVNVTLTIGWVLILVGVALFWIGVGWVAANLIQGLVGA